MRALIISADGFEDLELYYPYYRLAEAGVEVDVATLDGNPVKGKHGYECQANVAIAGADPAAYDLLLIPGGKAPAALRTDAAVIDLVEKFYQQEKPIAAICHGPQVLINARLVSGRRMTAYRSVQTELGQAGAVVLDEPVVLDGQFITSREPRDLPAFSREVMRSLGKLGASS